MPEAGGRGGMRAEEIRNRYRRGGEGNISGLLQMASNFSGIILHMATHPQ